MTRLLEIRRRTPASLAAAAAALAALFLLAAGPSLLGPGWLERLEMLFVYVILAVMWNALAGYAGQISIGQQAFFGLGAYATIRLAAAGLGAYPAILLGPVLVGLAAIPLGAVMLRLREAEFAIGMWVLAEFLHLAVNLDGLVQGETGTSLVALNAVPIDVRRATTYWVALLAMIATAGFVLVLLRSRLGLAAQAIRDDEPAAASLGVRVGTVKRVLFVFAAFGTALAGSLFLAGSSSFQPHTYFGVQWTAYMIFMVLVGGLGTFEGPILGAVLFFAVETFFGASGVWYLVLLGGIALTCALFLPRGLWGTFEARTGIRLAATTYEVVRLRPGGAAPTMPGAEVTSASPGRRSA